MIIRAIRLRDVRGFGEQGIAIEGIDGGLSVLAERNEFGKTTIFDSIRAALFYKHSSADKAVKSLAPHDGGAPLIELDLEFEGKLFRATKQFLRRAHAEIKDLGTSQIVAKDGDAHDWLLAAIGSAKPGAGPAGLLWVEQGQSMDLPNAGEEGGALLSSMLENEIGQVTGGERARLILNAARDRLSKIITRAGRPGGAYRDSIGARDEATEMVADLTKCVEKTEASHLELIDIDRELKGLEDKAVAQDSRDKIDTAQDALTSAQQVSERLEGLLRAKEDADAVADAAKTAHRRLVDDQESAVVNHKDIEELNKKIDALDQQVETARLDENQKRDACKDAEQAVIAAEAIERIANQAAEHKQAQKALLVAEQDLTAAVDATSSMIELTAQLSDIHIDEESLTQIEDLAQTAGVAQACIEALRPKLAVTLQPSGKGKVTIDGVIAADGDEWQLSGDVKIDVADIVMFSIRADDPSDAAAELDAARRGLQRALGSADVEDLKAAQTLMRKARDLETKWQCAEGDLKRVAPNGLVVLKGEVEKLRRKADKSVECGVTLDVAAENVVSARAFLVEAQLQLSNATQLKSEKREALSNCRGNIEPLVSRAAVLVEQLGEQSEWSAREKNARQVMENAKTEVDNRASAYTAAATRAPNLDAARALLTRLKQGEANRTERIRMLSGSRGEVVQTLRHAEAEGIEEQLGEAVGRLSALEDRCRAYEADARALHLLIDTLSSTQAALQDQFFEPVIAELNPLLAEVIPGAKVKLDEKFQADSLCRNGNLEKFDILSGGTREQVAVLCRLAFAKLMVSKGKPSPVILDDALVYEDDFRLEAMFTALNMAAQSGVQCLVFTCKQRAFGELGGNTLQWKPWLA